MKWNAEKVPDQRLCGHLRVTLDGREVDCVAFDTDRGFVELISEPVRVENGIIVTELLRGAVHAELRENTPDDEVREVFETMSGEQRLAEFRLAGPAQQRFSDGISVEPIDPHRPWNA